MSNSVDTRVVEMQFNNQNFEKNVNTSLNTLDKLKNALNFGKSAQSLTQLQSATNKVDFSPFANALDGIQNRFSSLGVVGMTVINNLTTGIMNKVKGLLTAIPQQISAGGLARAMNIENAKFQLKGLGIAWKDIEEDINYGVKDTAYGLDAAAKAASQLVASNVNLGTEMKEALRAISGVAAMTNASYEEISPIFTTVAGQGKLMTMQLRQLESRGLNVAASLGKSMGKTEEEIRDMVTKGKIDFKTFSHYMNEAFGDHAKKANETYSGSLGNVKAALSRIGAEFKTSRLENLRNIFISAIPAINKVKSDIAQTTTFINFLSSMITGKLASAIESIDIGPVMEKANGLLNNLDLGSGVKYSDISNLLGKVKEEGVLTTETLKETEKMGFNVASVLAKSFGKTEKEIRKDIKNGQIDYTRFASALGIAAVNGSKLGKVIDTIGSKAKELLNPVIYIFKQLGSIVKNVFSDISTGLQKGFKLSPLIALNKIFLLIKMALNDVGYALHTFLNYMAESGNSQKVIIFFEGVGNVLLSLYNILLVVSTYAGRAFRKIFFIGDETTIFTKAIDLVCDILEKLGKIMLHSENVTTGLLDTIVRFGSKTIEVIKNGLEPLITTFVTLNEKMDELTDSTGAIGKFFNTVANGLAAIGAFIGDAFAGLWENLVKPFEDNNTNLLLSFISALEVGLTSLLSLHFVDKLSNVSLAVEQFKGIIGTIKKPFWDLQIALQAMQRALKAQVLLKIGEAILMIVGAMFILSTLDKDKLAEATLAMMVLMRSLVSSFGEFSEFINVFDTTSVPKIIAMSGVFTHLGAALLLIAFAVKTLGSMDLKSLAQGLVSVMILLKQLTRFLDTLQAGLKDVSSNPLKGIGSTLIALAIALNLLIIPVKTLGGMDLASLAKGLGAVGIILGIFTGFFKLLNSKTIETTAPRISSIAKSLIIFAIGLNLLIIPVKTLGGMDLESLGKGLGAVAVMLGIFAGFFKLLNSKTIGTTAPRIASIAKSLVIFAVAINLLAIPVKTLGGMDLLSLGKGLGSVAIMLGMVVAALAVLNKLSVNENEIIKAAGAITLISVAMVILSKAIKTLGGMDQDSLITGLLGLGTALTVVVIAGIGAEAAATGLMALGGAIALIGVGMLGIGAGMFAFASGLSVLAATGVAGIAILAEGLIALINMIPLFMTQLGNGIIALLDVLANSTDSFIDFGVTIITSFLEGIIQTVPKLVETIGVLIDALFTVVTEQLPKLVDLGLTIIFEFLRGVEEALPELVNRAFTIMITFIDSLSAAIEENGDELVDSIWNLFVTIIEKIWEVLTGAIASIWEKGKELGSNLLNGIKELKDSIVNWFKEKFEAVKAFFTSIAEAFWNDGKGIGTKLLEGIKELKDSIVEWFKEKFEAIKEFFTGITEAFWNDGKGIGTSLLDGIKELKDKILNWFKEKFEAVKEFFTGIAVAFWNDGKGIGSKLLGGIQELKDNILNWFKEKFEAVKTFFTNIAEAFWNDGKGIGSKLLEGIKELKDGILNWFKEKIQAVKDWFGTLWKDFKESGKNLIDGLIAGMEEVPILGSVIKLGRNIKNAFNNSVEVQSPSKATKRTGKYFVQGFIVGVNQNSKQAENTVERFGLKLCQKVVLGLEKGKSQIRQSLKGIISIFDINGTIIKFTSTALKDTQKELDKILKSTAKSFKTQKGIIDEYLKDFTKYKTQYKTIYSGLVNQNGIGNVVAKKIKIPKEQTKIFKNTAKLVGNFAISLYKASEAYSKAVNNVRAYNAALKDEREQLKKLKKERPELTEKLEKQNKKLNKLEKERKKLEKERKKLEKENTAESKKKIKEIDKEIKKKDEAISKEEKRIQKTTDALNNNKKATKDTVDTIKALNKALKQELKDISKGPKEALKEYKKTLKEMVKSSTDLLNLAVTNQVNLFEQYEQNEAISAETLLNNMQSQILGVNQWQRDIDRLTKKGLDKGLIERLREMGPEGAKYVQAFLSMTNEEIKKANLMYKAEGQLVGEQLLDDAKAKMNAIKQWSNNITALAQRGLSYDVLKDLVDQGYDNAEYVQALVNMTDEQLREMSSLYVKEDKLPTTIANNIAAALSYALNQVGENVLPSMGGIDPVTSVILNSMKDSQDELTTASTEVVTALADGIADSAQVMLDATRLIGDTTVNTFREYFNTDNGTTIGVEITAGIVTGLITGKDAVAAAAEELAQTIDDTVSDELEIHSPSKKMITIGKFINEGLASGLKKYSALVVKSATEVGTSTKNTIADTINAISSFFDNDFNQPVIRPTLDLSDISKNANRIDNMFNSGVSLFGQTGENGEIQNGKVFNFTQNNYSPKALPRIEIYRQTRNQFSALKGLV